MASNTLRMSGLNSGLDTEAIVNALTAATKNKINKNQRSIMKLQAQQEAYRSIIDKFNAFKSKYLDILNVGTCLKSKTMFNSFKSTLTSSTGTNYVPGVTVSSSPNANQGSYDVKVESVATQATRKSSSYTGKEIDLSEYNEAGMKYTMSVTVGDKSTYVTFDGSSDEDEIRKQINQQLADYFGTSNNTATTGRGRVYLDDNGKIVSTDKSAVVVGSAIKYHSDERVYEGALGTGKNTITINIDGKDRTVTFDTIADDYFDGVFELDENGKVVFDEDGNIKYAEGADRAKIKLFEDVILNQRDGELYDSYEKWWKGEYDEESDSWNLGITEAEKKAFAEHVAKSKYDSEIKEIEDKFDQNYEAALKLYIHKQAMGDLKPGDEGYISFSDYFDGNEEAGIPAHAISEEDKAAFEETDEYKKLVEKRDSDKEKVLKTYSKYTEAVVKKEVDAAYKEQFELAKAEAKQAAYDEAKAAAKQAAWEEAMAGKVEGVDDDYVSLDDFEFEFTDIEDFKFTYTDADFKALDENDEPVNQYYKAYLDKEQEITDYYMDEDHLFTVDLDKMSESQRIALYDEFKTAEEKGVLDKKDYIKNYIEENGVQGVIDQFNKSNIENNLNSLSSVYGLYEVQASYDPENGKVSIKVVDGDGNNLDFAITQREGGATDFGFEITDVTGTASQVSTSSTLDELGIPADANGNYSFSINGVDFTFSGDTTISDMMKKINASTAGVKMSYTTLTSQFVITANEYGRDVEIDLKDTSGVLEALGFEKKADGTLGDFTEGTNTVLIINGEEIETNSNSYTVDGTTFTFTQAAVGQEFNNEVSRDYSKAIDTIKSFVADYNELIDFIYGYVDDEPNNDYYFLTDDDLDEMDLSDSQATKWENMAKKGLLYRDSTLTDIMSKLRTVLYNSVDAADGSKVGLYTLGITTSSDYTNHGKLVFDDTKDFEALFEQYADEITTLFTDSEKGIATQFERIIDNATRTTGAAGERGTLVDKAGVSGTASATSNTIYNKIKSLQDMIATLKARYEQQQDRYWKIYGNMETMLGNLNSQTSYINQLLGNY